MQPDQANELRRRTKQFALRIVRLCRALPYNSEGKIIGNQLLRSGTSVGANYRAACRSRSGTEFASRLAVVIEQTDETIYWLELLAEAGNVPASRLKELVAEAEEFVRLFSAARRTTLAHTRNQN